MKVGYARVSKQDQRLESQRESLKADDCRRVFEEKVTSRQEDRPQLRAAMDYWTFPGRTDRFALRCPSFAQSILLEVCRTTVAK